ncbi:MAG: GNAT family N-acetyltransferase, partial [Pseudonocardia sp.]|nr:GNAT family N-acetyltransferase [Pseudonocardia sp.]
MIDDEVRPARPDEFAAVGALTADGYRADGLLSRSGGTDHYEAELLDAAARAAAAELLVAADPGGRLLGTLTWCPPGSGLRELATGLDQGEFRMLAVAPAARRRGVARALVRHCLAEARRLGLGELVLSSLPGMTAAHALYAGFGF